MVPISAHALFARPLVIAPDSTVGDHGGADTGHDGVLWCDGRRDIDLPAGARVEVRRGSQPVRLARLHDARRSPSGWWRSSGCRWSGWRGDERRG